MINIVGLFSGFLWQTDGMFLIRAFRAQVTTFDQQATNRTTNQSGQHEAQRGHRHTKLGCAIKTSGLCNIGGPGNRRTVPPNQCGRAEQNARLGWVSKEQCPRRTNQVLEYNRD